MVNSMYKKHIVVIPPDNSWPITIKIGPAGEKNLLRCCRKLKIFSHNDESTISIILSSSHLAQYFFRLLWITYNLPRGIELVIFSFVIFVFFVLPSLVLIFFQ